MYKLKRKWSFLYLQSKALVYLVMQRTGGHFHAGNLATIYYEQRQLDTAIHCYRQAIVCDSRFVEAYNNMVSHAVLLCS
jgi:tetratricopeptide (TPR) repeat protein